MNSDVARGKWQQLKGAVTVQWGRMTGDQLRVIAGRHLQRVGRLHAACGRAQAEVGRQIDRVRRRSRALRGKGGSFGLKEMPMLVGRVLFMGLVALAALLSGSLAANTGTDPRTNPAWQSNAYGTVESIEPDPAASEPPDAIAGAVCRRRWSGSGKKAEVRVL